MGIYAKKYIVESFLAEDDNESKTKKILESIKSWFKEAKSRLKQIIGKFQEKIVDSVKGFTYNENGEINEELGKDIVNLQKQVVDDNNKYNKLSEELLKLDRKIIEYAGRPGSNIDEIRDAFEKTFEIEEKLRLLDQRREDLKNEIYRTKRKIKENKISDRKKKINGVFSVFKKFSDYMVNSVKNSINRVVDFIKFGDSSVDKSKSKGSSFLGKIFSVLKSIGGKFKRIVSDIVTFVQLVHLSIKAGIIMAKNS